MTQEQKRNLEKEIGRHFSDATWYRIRKQLIAIGVSEDDFPSAFKLIAAMNKGGNGKGKIALIPYQFIDVWKEFSKQCNKASAEKMFTCGDFITFITRNQDYSPKPRFKQGKPIGINTIWYRWFNSCGLSFSMNKKYKLSELFPVVAYYYSWKYKQSKKLDLPVIDVEVA